jgi:RimJ/RimL family protein N-acetyltransferase
MYRPFLEGEKVYLRGIEENDLSGEYFQWFNDAVTCRYNSHATFPNSEKRMRDYFNHVEDASDMVVFAIIEKETGKHVGNVSLQQIDWISRNAEIAWIIGSEHGGNGYGTEAGKLVIQYAFERLNLMRIYCGTSAENIPMQKVIEKLDMKKEGIRQKAMYKMGKYVDIYEYGILREGMI